MPHAEEIKFRMLNLKKLHMPKAQKVDVVSDIIKDIAMRSLEKGLSVSKYPINL